MTTETIEIHASGINNLKDIHAKLPLRKVVCFTGKSGSGKSTLAFDVIYHAGKTKEWNTSHYSVSKLPKVYALQQKTRTSVAPVSVARYVGLTRFVQNIHKSAECPFCRGTGVEMDVKPGIVGNPNTLRKLGLITEFKSLVSAIEHQMDVRQILVESFQKESQNEDIYNILASIVEMKPCSRCCGAGVFSAVIRDDLKSFFGKIVPEIFPDVDKITETMSLFQPISIVGATGWQWIRILKILLEMDDGGLVILDEPMAGMAAFDAQRMMTVVRRMVKALNCSVILIEHAETAILESDYILEIGPGAGCNGGKIVFSGPRDSYLNAKTQVSICFPIQKHNEPRNKSRRFAKVSGINEYGFSDETLLFPLFRLSCISGLTQTGKTGLLKVISRAFNKSSFSWCERLGLGSIQGRADIRRMQSVTQNPIGNNPHSIPATYINAMDSLRTYYSESQSDGKLPIESFSFNSPAGWCDNCHGYGGKMVEDGEISRWETCAECGGNRYNNMVRAIRINGFNIGEFLRLTVQETLEFKQFFPLVVNRTELIAKLGLGYIPLGQPSTTLSGGEAQRIKLGKFLAKKSGDRTIYVLDNPSKGLSAPDVPLLIKVLHELSMKNTVVVADNHPLFINGCDYSIVLKKERSRNSIAYMGSPDDMPSKLVKFIYRT